jgi:hypothetical protein
VNATALADAAAGCATTSFTHAGIAPGRYDEGRSPTSTTPDMLATTASRPHSAPSRARCYHSAAMPIPGVNEVDAIAAMADGAARNLRITQAYFELSTGLAEWVGAGGTWCAFATWASKQAGRTIRGEDLGVVLERRLALHPPVQAVLRNVRRDLGLSKEALARAIAEAVRRLPAVQRASVAVARGNNKVFSEIGRHIATLLALAGGAGGLDGPRMQAFCETLPPGPPPGGQSLLREAFACYLRAREAPTPPARAQWIFFANLQIGLHEQTRLQPEIQESLEAAVIDERTLEALIEAILIAQIGSPATARLRARVVRQTTRLLAREVRPIVRRVMTERVMSIELGNGEVLRLGEDIPRPFAPSLARLESEALRAFLATVDPRPDSAAGSGASDWGSLSDRMQFIAELFRAYQEEPSLMWPPFGTAKTQGGAM